MGTDKALLPVDGVPMVLRVAAALRAAGCEPVVAIGGDEPALRRLGLQVLMGAHPRDPWSFTAPLNGPAPNGPIRVAVVTAPPGGTCDPTVSATVRRAADALANAGYEVVDACPPRYEEVAATWARLLMGDFASVLDQLMPLMGEGGKTFLATANAAVAPLTSTTDMSQLLALRHGLGRAWSQFMAEHPLVLTTGVAPLGHPALAGLATLAKDVPADGRRPQVREWRHELTVHRSAGKMCPECVPHSTDLAEPQMTTYL